MNYYKVLDKQVYREDNFSIVPIRQEDRYLIMSWRNEQIYHLRQAEPLNEELQDNYFKNVVASLFNEDKPNQILFSYLDGEECIGYGGLVHINWIDKNAEISFLMKTILEKTSFKLHWKNFLGLIEKVAFEELSFHKLYTYAYEIRPHLFEVLEEMNYIKDARLKDHCFFEDKFIDVLIHAKWNYSPQLRKANKQDLIKTFEWANDPVIRKYSFKRNPIEFSDHCKWFFSKLDSNQTEYFILEVNNEMAGSIRFDLDKNISAGKISYLIDPSFAGKGLGTKLLRMGEEKIKESRPEIKKLYGLVFVENSASIRIFEKLNYKMTYKTENDCYFEKNIL